MQIPELILKHAPWSPTMANTAVNCSHAFQRRYVNKERTVEVDSDESAVGKAVHKILEWTMQEEAPVAVDKAFAQAIESFSLTHDQQLRVLSYRGAVEAFLKGMKDFARSSVGVHKVLTETKVALTPDWRVTKFFSPEGLIRGIIDLVVITKDKRAIIVDHKTGAVKPISMYQEQTEIYSVFVDALITGLRSVRIAVHYVGADPNVNGKRTVWAPEYSIEVVRTQFRENLINYLLKAAEAAESNTPNKCWLCRFCGYQSVCPAYA